MKSNSFCEDHNAVNGCWCNDSYRCVDDLVCSGGFCVDDSQCSPGDAGCECTTSGECFADGAVCRTIAGRSICVADMVPPTTVTAVASASSMLLAALVALVALAAAMF